MNNGSQTELSEMSFLTVSEVALIVRVSKMTVYRLVHCGDLEAVRVGRSFRIPESSVDKYLKESFVGTESDAMAWEHRREQRMLALRLPRGRTVRVSAHPPRTISSTG